MKIGIFTVNRSKNDPSCISIYKEDGEGGDFNEAVLSAWLEVFYEKNF